MGILRRLEFGGRFVCSFDIVSMASSFGGIQALSQVLSTLPPDFPVPIVVVQHMAPAKESHLVNILARQTKLKVEQAETDQVIHRGCIYVAPPNRHLMVQPGGILLLADSPRVHFVRPSASVLFESIAAVFHDRAIGVILTGMGSDGSEGVRAIKNAGGRVIVQDKKTAQAFAMPRAAIRTGCYDFVLPLDNIAAALIALTMVPGAADLFQVATPLPALLS